MRYAQQVKNLLLEGHRVVVNLTELEHIDSMGRDDRRPS